MKTGTETAIALFEELTEIHRELVELKGKNEKQNQKCSSDRIDGGDDGSSEATCTGMRLLRRSGSRLGFWPVQYSGCGGVFDRKLPHVQQLLRFLVSPGGADRRIND